MIIKQLILRNLKKNLKNYYLYVFALIFTVALYFAFVTLQYDPAMDEAKGSIKGAAAIRSASVILIAIVSIFLLYANNIFIKHRSKEIGLFQLIGMTKKEMFRILLVENFLLFYSSLLIGILVGFSFSRLMMMILLKITGVEAIARLRFSPEALLQTGIVFSAIFLLVTVTNYRFIKMQTILSLFRVVTSAEEKVKKVSIFEMLLGIAGIFFIIIGYYVSSKLFSGAFTTINELFLAMMFILGAVIIGTYLWYKGSVSFIANIIRNKKNGHLNINEVLSLSSIMFRMKSNALLLTVITTVSALAIGLLSLSYISYYSAEKAAENYVPNHFSFSNVDDVGEFKNALDFAGIPYSEQIIDVIQVKANLVQILDAKLDDLTIDPTAMPLPVISENDVSGLNLTSEEAKLSGNNDMMQKFMALKESGTIELHGKTEAIPLQLNGINKDYILPIYFTAGGLPVVIVDETVFKRLQKDIEATIQKESTVYVGIDVNQKAHIVKANDIFHEMEMTFSGNNDSRLDMSNNQKKKMGLVMFIVGFLGLTFLVTSGCILYFKQMDESEDEKQNYTILRKLGFTQSDLLKGIQIKQLFNFGIPLLIGLSHGYFAVQSGWFLFGTELWTPMFVVMVLYTTLYSTFGILSILYSKKVIKEAL
ncbi:ABC transporter permease [Calidifontibacillus oryziterrae]|uniref:ABC transporter permease n=1 Tax=Calidifontibacillus oryziterrae TaxID=1191699 RepID=UPI0002F83D9A|nr:ABC transporter permease [Calidifontibacillus oryziterrae]